MRCAARAVRPGAAADGRKNRWSLRKRRCRWFYSPRRDCLRRVCVTCTTRTSVSKLPIDIFCTSIRRWLDTSRSRFRRDTGNGASELFTLQPDGGRQLGRDGLHPGPAAASSGFEPKQRVVGARQRRIFRNTGDQDYSGTLLQRSGFANGGARGGGESGVRQEVFQG